ncbi:hypothetical protein sr16287 [Sporisorium reilianum SRZ2]|uniref:Uncharacterized protein n=1 Tax=Sporisorium reilianum (strain SRZ2) TaxID=999809 RepID=E6ZS10_SPORE|nr:hypothetical protein sr16287 [Sporisorium reilianum SRZ2]
MFFVIILAIDADSDTWCGWYDQLPFNLRYGHEENKLVSFGIFGTRQEVLELWHACETLQLGGEMYLVPQDLFHELFACFSVRYREDGARGDGCMENGEMLVRARGSLVLSWQCVEAALDDWVWWGQMAL